MYKALKNFSGLISAYEGQILEIEDDNVIQDLLEAGYIEEIKGNIEGVEKTTSSIIKTDKKKK